MNLRVLRTAVTNDFIRKLIMEFISDDVEMLDKFIKRIKLRGWINQAPLYPNVPKESDESIDCGEAKKRCWFLTKGVTMEWLVLQYSQLKKSKNF